tara:strand:+ start:261 stop:1613 length:1353 start_codon:yes stop_codon:yes gene_type:complete
MVKIVMSRLLLNIGHNKSTSLARISFHKAVKRLIFLTSIVFSLSLLTSPPAAANPKYASIIVEESSGQVLYSRSADKQLFPASLTKIMTLYLLFEALQNRRITLGTRMKVSKVAASRSPSKLYLKPGQTITVENAILALVTKSANDVATVVSEHLGGNERNFAKKMTRKAKAIGMKRTIFKNASGLPNQAQLSTARDMARLGIAIRQDFPQYFKYFNSTSFNWKGRKFRNHNKLLTQFKGTDGIKTGYINASGFNLVATTERNGVRLVGVVFGGKTGKSRDKHMISLLNRQFERIKPVQVKSMPLPTTPLSRPDNFLAANLQPEFQKPTVTNDLQTASRPPVRAETTSPDPLVNTLSLQVSVPPPLWSIQVGSFTRRVSAHKAAIKARQTARDTLNLTPAELSVVTRGGLPLWRVRFRNLDENRARAACAALLSAGSTCIALPVSVTDAG